MDIQGKIILALPEQSGVSKAGNQWKKREYVLETHETYPKKVCFTFFGDRADQYPLNPGDEVKISFDLSSREYNGRWYTEVSGWKAEKVDTNAPAAAPQAAPYAPTAPAAAPAPDLTAPAGEDDLPF